MPQTIHKKIFDSTATGVSPSTINLRPDIAGYADLRGNTSAKTVIIQVTGGAGTPTVVLEGSVPQPPEAGATSTWTAVAHRPAGGGAYSAAAISVATGNSLQEFFDPNDQPQFIRANVTANAGAARVEVWLVLEV